MAVIDGCETVSDIGGFHSSILLSFFNKVYHKIKGPAKRSLVFLFYNLEFGFGNTNYSGL